MQVEEKRVDSQGRVSLPADWRRRHLGADGTVVIIQVGEELLIKARISHKPSEFFDSLKAEVKSDLSDWGSVRRELLSPESGPG
jgi:bifunctional DNA-binding transcriptional regulator/antitoxin component of YhaV-PrlF toxin-antitoxin module